MVLCSSVKKHLTSGCHSLHVSNICLWPLIPPLSHTHKFQRSEFLGKVTCISSILVNLISVQHLLKTYNVEDTVPPRYLGGCRASEERHNTQRLGRTRKKPLSTGYPNLPRTSKKAAASFVFFPNEPNIQGSQKKTFHLEANPCERVGNILHCC